jgi:hypothetical protein
MTDAMFIVKHAVDSRLVIGSPARKNGGGGLSEGFTNCRRPVPVEFMLHPTPEAN